MKKLIIAMLFLLFSTHNNHPMQRLAAKLGQSSLKSIATKGFSGLMTGLHWGIAAGVPLTVAINAMINPFNENNYENADPQVIDFITSQSSISLNSVKTMPIQSPMVAGKNHIVISHTCNRKIKKALQNNNQIKLN